MKRIITIVLLSISFVAFSQNKVNLGLKAGVNLSALSNANLDSKVNGYGGVFLNVAFTDLYEFQPEVFYSNQGGKVKNGDGTLNLEYISLSIANHFFVNRDGRFFLSIVPSIDFDIDDTFVGLVNRGEDGEGNEATFVDITIGAGLGYRFSNGLAVEARYKRGIVDVYSGSFHSFESEQYEFENQFNSVFQIGLSYRFNMSKKED
jgi:opacity protein-like surface antigen